MNDNFDSIKSNTRDTTIDCLKGLAIVLVVLGHVIDGNRAQNVIHGQWLDYLYNAIYLFHMPLFFVLSGMALHLSTRKQRGGGVDRELPESAHPISVLAAFLQYISRCVCLGCE